MRILLADDHPMISTAIEALLRGTEFEIAGMASTGEQAIQKAMVLGHIGFGPLVKGLFGFFH